MSEVSSIRAILDQGAVFHGRLSFDGAVRIAGEFEGEIKSGGTLIIEPSGRVKADIQVQTLILSGRLEGKVQAQRQVCMHPPARFTGTVKSPSLKIDEGVIFEGTSQRYEKSS